MLSADHATYCFLGVRTDSLTTAIGPGPYNKAGLPVSIRDPGLIFHYRRHCWTFRQASLSYCLSPWAWGCSWSGHLSAPGLGLGLRIGQEDDSAAASKRCCADSDADAGMASAPWPSSDADAGLASAPWPSSTVLRAPYLDVVIALFLELTCLHQAHHALIAVQGIGLDVIELFKL